MTAKQIREEMKTRLELVRASASLAISAIEQEDFSSMGKLLDDIKMYSERARLDHEAAYKSVRG